jgi:hypothetical protein
MNWEKIIAGSVLIAAVAALIIPRSQEGKSNDIPQMV